jgi:hypothetical protein
LEFVIFQPLVHGANSMEKVFLSVEAPIGAQCL